MLDLDDAFEELMRNAYPDVPAYEAQYVESRSIFYAGAFALYLNVLELADLPVDEAEKGLSSIRQQIDGFLEALKKDQA